MTIRKLKRDLRALERGHRVKVKQIMGQPITVGEIRRSLPSYVTTRELTPRQQDAVVTKQHRFPKHQDVAKKPNRCQGDQHFQGC